MGLSNQIKYIRHRVHNIKFIKISFHLAGQTGDICEIRESELPPDIWQFLRSDSRAHVAVVTS